MQYHVHIIIDTLWYPLHTNAQENINEEREIWYRTIVPQPLSLSLSFSLCAAKLEQRSPSCVHCSVLLFLPIAGLPCSLCSAAGQCSNEAASGAKNQEQEQAGSGAEAASEFRSSWYHILLVASA